MSALTALKQLGKAPEMPLKKIVHDPDNPRPPLHLRTAEEQQKQRELNANIKERGIKSPISLRPHPCIPDQWIINHGHCRYDGAEAAGLATIPYFVDPNYDSYDQIGENLHRSDLSIWAIAAFIKRRLDSGESKGEIANRLGKEGQNYITEHLALVDAPSCVHQAYESGIHSPRTLYDLRRAYDEFPDQIESWCASGAPITRDTVKSQLVMLRGKNQDQHSKRSGPDQTESLRTAPKADNEESLLPMANRAGTLRHDVKLKDESSISDGGSRSSALSPTLAFDSDVRQLSARGERTSRSNSLGPNTSFHGDQAESTATAAFDISYKQTPRLHVAESPIPQPAVKTIPALYMGRPAWVMPDTRISIQVEGEETIIQVLASELVFNNFN